MTTGSGYTSAPQIFLTPHKRVIIAATRHFGFVVSDADTSEHLYAGPLDEGAWQIIQTALTSPRPIGG